MKKRSKIDEEKLKTDLQSILNRNQLILEVLQRVNNMDGSEESPLDLLIKEIEKEGLFEETSLETAKI